MYSEHIVATLLDLTQRSYYYGYELDRDLTRITVSVGRILGPDLGCEPSDGALSWYCQRFGTPAALGSRASFHVLRDSRVGVGLGPGRGVIETVGPELAIVSSPETGRYTGAWRLPNVEHGGLI